MILFLEKERFQALKLLYRCHCLRHHPHYPKLCQGRLASLCRTSHIGSGIEDIVSLFQYIAGFMSGDTTVIIGSILRQLCFQQQFFCLTRLQFFCLRKCSQLAQRLS